MAAHIAFVASGSIPSGSSGKGKYSLIGCDGNSPLHRGVNDASSVLGLRMAEIIEWSIVRGSIEAAKKNSDEDTNSGSGLSFGSLFGLGGGNKKDSKTEATNSVVRSPVKRATFDTLSPERVLRLRVALIYPKLKFAMWLADMVKLQVKLEEILFNGILFILRDSLTLLWHMPPMPKKLLGYVKMQVSDLILIAFLR